MSSWANQRKLIYVSSMILFFLLIIGVPSFLAFYKAPTHTDGIKNDGELGIDCGGTAPKLCQNAFMGSNIDDMSKYVMWKRLELLSPKLYNVAVYIVNPNIEAEAKNVPYHMAILDAQGSKIKDVTGTVTLPPHRNTIAFNGAVNVGERTPSSVFFEFTAAPNWIKKADTLAPIVVADKKYTEDSVGSSLDVTLKNSSVRQIPRIAVAAVLYDKDGISIGFSKTYIDGIDAMGTASAPFTWQKNRNGAVVSIEVLPVAE